MTERAKHSFEGTEAYKEGFKEGMAKGAELAYQNGLSQGYFNGLRGIYKILLTYIDIAENQPSVEYSYKVLVEMLKNTKILLDINDKE